MIIDKTSEIACDDYTVEIAADDTCLVLNGMELDELVICMEEWVAQNNIIKVQTVARLLSLIKEFKAQEDS